MILGGCLRTSLHPCHNLCGWCFLQLSISAKVFTGSLRVMSSLCRRKCVGGQSRLKLSTRWNCQLWSCNGICSTGLSEGISFLLADASYCLLWIFYVCLRVSLLWFCMDYFSLISCQDSFNLLLKAMIPVLFGWWISFLVCLCLPLP